jgi:hypothetical protein
MTTTPTTAPGPVSPGPCMPCAASSSPGRGKLWCHVRPQPAARPGPGVPDLSQQGHRTGLKGSVAHPRGPSWRVPVTCLRPQRPTWGAVNVAVRDRQHGNWRGLIRDAVGCGVRLVDSAGIPTHRCGSPRRGIYRPDACTVSRRGVATTRLPVQDRHPGRPCDRNRDTVRGAGGPCSVAPRSQASVPGRYVAAATGSSRTDHA